MNTEIIQALLLAVFGGAIVGVYFLYNFLARKWLGIETYGAPLPAVMRWTMFFGAIVTVLVLCFVIITFLGSRWYV